MSQNLTRRAAVACAALGLLAACSSSKSISSAATDTAAFVQSDAWLVVANARMHLVHDWDILLEARELGTVQPQGRDFGVLSAAYKQLGNNLEIGLGYNFGQISDDLTDLTDNSQGAFINLITKF